jgi:hypothetical protein
MEKKDHFLVNVVTTHFSLFGAYNNPPMELKGVISDLAMNFEDKKVVVRLENETQRLDCTVARVSPMYEWLLGVMSQLRPSAVVEIVVGGYKQDGEMLQPKPVDTESEIQFDLIADDFERRFKNIYLKRN